MRSKLQRIFELLQKVQNTKFRDSSSQGTHRKAKNEQVEDDVTTSAHPKPSYRHLQNLRHWFWLRVRNQQSQILSHTWALLPWRLKVIQM